MSVDAYIIVLAVIGSLTIISATMFIFWLVYIIYLNLIIIK